MLKPSFRLLILPLGAVSMIATLSSQQGQQVQRESVQQMRQEIVACPPNSKTDICAIGEKAPR